MAHTTTTAVREIVPGDPVWYLSTNKYTGYITRLPARVIDTDVMAQRGYVWICDPATRNERWLWANRQQVEQIWQ